MPKEGRKLKRRKRTIITPAQLEKLEALYRLEHWPSKAHKDLLAQELGTTGHFVSIWFQNKRARVKREQEMASSNTSRPTSKKKKPKPQLQQASKSKMKLSLEMNMKPSPARGRSHAHGHAHKSRFSLLPRNRSHWSSKCRPSNLSRSAYGLPFSFFPDVEVGSRPSATGPDQNPKNKELGTVLKSEPQDCDLQDCQEQPTNGTPSESVTDSPIIVKEGTGEANNYKSYIETPPTALNAGGCHTSPVPATKCSPPFHRDADRLDRLEVCTVKGSHLVDKLENFLDDVGQRLNLEPDIMKCVKNFVSPKSEGPLTDTSMRQEPTDDLAAAAMQESPSKITSAEHGDDKTDGNTTSTSSAPGLTDDCSLRNKPPTLFRCIVCMMALAEGGIIPPDESQFRNLIVWLEDQKVRHYKIEERANLRNIVGGDWEKAFDKYLTDLNAPVQRNPRNAAIDWLLGYAVRLEYGDNVEKYKTMSGCAAATPAAAVTNPLEKLEVNDPNFKAGVVSLATLLEIPPHADHLQVLKAVSLLVQERLSGTALSKHDAEGVKHAKNITLDQVELGFETSDYISLEAAKILRLLHIRELRDLQNEVNAAIVAVQELTANPKTDTRLGKVGRT